MISIIVCSLRPELDQTLLQNIDSTVGLPYEVICVDNSGGRYSIFEAYNFGASTAKYDLLCFMHEDILFRSADWGRIVAGKLADQEVGVIGVAGAVYKSASPSPWWISDIQDQTAYHRLHLLQHFSSGIKKQCARGSDKAGVAGGTSGDAGGDADRWDEVLVLDGVWLCCRKAVWQETPFDERQYGGFHFYDLDFSLAVHRKGFRNYVSQEILIEHFSAGNMDKNWIRGAKVFHRKWRKALPASVGQLPAAEISELELSAARNFLRILTYNRHRNPLLWLKYWIRTAVHKPFGKDTWRSFLNYGRTYLK